MITQHRSRQEANLRKVYPELPYEYGGFDYTTTHRYTPDFYLGNNIYLECKEFMAYAECQRYEFIAASNPQLDLRFLILRCSDKVEARLRKTFKVSISHTIPQQWLTEGQQA
jgi:hypothetical protein